MSGPSGDNVPFFDLGSFEFGVTSDGLEEPSPELGVLGLLENKAFKGQGYNCIFRPRSKKPLEDEDPVEGEKGQDNDLQLNLTVETLTFSGSIGRVPNRGLFEQDDIILGGITYVDSVQDVTNPDTGLGDLKPGTGIHIEPGIWMAVPKSSDVFKKDMLCRMASIPHGTTINAQGLQPSLKPIAGKPNFDKVDITPFFIDSGGKATFNNMKFDMTTEDNGKVKGNNRIPQNLQKFKDMGTITPAILENPNQVLTNAISGQNIVNFIKFDVTTASTGDFNGGGTTNIAFLGNGKSTTNDFSGPKVNASAFSMQSTFWIETVECKFSVKGGNPKETSKSPAGEFGPTFKIPPTLGRSGDIHFTVNYTQLQYSQTVLLNFFGLSWPHVSVATLGEQTTFNLVLPPDTTVAPPIPPIPDDTPDPRAVCGEWSKVFPLDNVAAHASLLPTGKVLYWGRRAVPGNPNPKSMEEKATNTFLWDPVTGKSEATKTNPKLTTGKDVNLFCSAHCFQPDGTLFVVGGHLEDNHGVNQACVYNPFNDTWTPRPRMNFGRWYPSALTLNDGSVLAISGTYFDDTDNSTPVNDIPQIWRKDGWISMPRASNSILQSFPRLHLDPNGRIFMAGPQAQSQFFDESVDDGVGAWTTDGPERAAQARDYASSVMYDSGKILYIGGGIPPTNMVESIDLHDTKPSWTPSTNMEFPRRQHNGTVLPDGTVLVTGGTKGTNGPSDGFNDLTPGEPVHVPELCDPFAKPPKWTKMAKESVDRCYHSIALLLPDGQVLSAGGGEGGTPPEPDFPNLKFSHPDAQIFAPPYLFKGPRPTVSSAPSDIDYKQQFEVTVGPDDSISKVSWVRLGSVTHACNMSQSLTFLAFQQQGTKVSVEAPADSNVAPPGYYMLFLLSRKGVPSVASMICIARHGTVPPKKPKTNAADTHRTARPKDYKLSLPARNEKIMAEQDKPAVAVGLTPSCPYGLGSCWGAAFDGLRDISDVDVVRPVPDQAQSIAHVYLKEDILPDIDVWRKEFERTANKLYTMRGIEMTLSGAVIRHHLGTDEQLILTGTSTRQDVVLAPFYPSSKLEWDRVANAPKEVTDAETGAWARLSDELEQGLLNNQTVQATGRLHKHGANNFSLDVREWKVADDIGIPNGV